MKGFNVTPQTRAFLSSHLRGASTRAASVMAGQFMRLVKDTLSNSGLEPVGQARTPRSWRTAIYDDVADTVADEEEETLVLKRMPPYPPPPPPSDQFEAVIETRRNSLVPNDEVAKKLQDKRMQHREAKSRRARDNKKTKKERAAVKSSDDEGQVVHGGWISNVIVNAGLSMAPDPNEIIGVEEEWA